MNLSSSQEAAVSATGAIVAVAAGPGSGKSRCLAERVMRRNDEFQMRRKVICITYTNAGAHVMAERLKSIRVDFIGTLHAFCYKLIQQHGPAIGYRAGGVNLLSEEDAKALLERIAKELHFKGSFKALAEKRDALAQLCWKEYAHRMRQNNLVDFDTVLVAGLDLIKCGCGACDDLYCDEVQDSAAIDWQIYLAWKAENKFFVGDGDQSVYAFRGAYPAGFLKVCRNSELIRLEENYRSSPAICRAATALIRHNQTRIDKDVIATDSTERGGIWIHQYGDCLAERRAVTASVAGLIPVLGPQEIAVICRTNWLCDQFREALRAAGVPVAATERPPLPPDWQHGMNVLALWLDPRNDMIAEKVLKRISPESVTALKMIALNKGEWLSTAAAYSAHTIKEIGLLARYNVSAEMVEHVANRARLLPQPNPTLADLVYDLRSHAAGDADNATLGVGVWTLHGAKGQEREAIFLPACEDGITPSLKKDSDIEEERRLFFVGLTRAKSEAYVSHAARRQPQWGPPVDCSPSRFISECGII